MIDIIKYDAVFVGSSLTGSVIASHIAKVLEKRVLVIEQWVHRDGLNHFLK